MKVVLSSKYEQIFSKDVLRLRFSQNLIWQNIQKHIIIFKVGETEIPSFKIINTPRLFICEGLKQII